MHISDKIIFTPSSTMLTSGRQPIRDPPVVAFRDVAVQWLKRERNDRERYEGVIAGKLCGFDPSQDRVDVYLEEFQLDFNFFCYTGTL